LAVEFAQTGFSVTGIDLSESKVERINARDSYIQDVPSREIDELVTAGKISRDNRFQPYR